MPDVAVAQPELPLQAPPKAQPSKAARFEIPADAEVSITQQPVEKTAPAPVKDANTAESAPAAEPDAKPEPEAPSDEETAKREERRRQNKLEKAYRQRAEAKARADFLEKQLAETQARANASPVDAGAPRLEQFDFDQDKFAKALTDYTTKKAEKEIQAKQQAESQKQYQAKLVAGWEEKVDKVEDKYEDYHSVVGEVSPNSPVAIAIMEADNGPDVAYFLGKNLKEAQRIFSLPLLSQIREIGKLEQKLSAEPKTPKTPSKAPAPIAPLTGSPAPVTGEDFINSKDISDAELNRWMKERSKKVHARR